MSMFFLSTALFGISIALAQKVTHAESRSAGQVNDIAVGIVVQVAGGLTLDQNVDLIGVHSKENREDRIKIERNSRFLRKQLIAADSDRSIPPLPELLRRPQEQLSSAAAYIQSALYRSQTSDWAGMIEDCSRAIALEPRNAQAYFLRGYAHQANGSYLSKVSEIHVAESDLDQALRFNPQYAEAYQGRAWVRARLNNYLGALADLDRFVALRPREIRSYADRALLKRRMNDLTGALADLDKAISLERPERPEGQFANSVFGVPHVDLYGARNLYEARGSLREEMGDSEGALADYDKVIQLEPRGFRNYFTRGKLKAKLNRLADALVDYNQGIGIIETWDGEYRVESLYVRGSDPTEHERYQRALIREKLKDFTGALSDYNHVVESYRGDVQSEHYPSLRVNLAKVMVNRADLKAYKLNDTRGALADYDAAIEHMRNLTDNKQGAKNYPYAYYSRGYLKAINLNDPSGALEDFNIAIEQLPTYADAYYERGVLKKNKLQSPSGAIKDLTRALELYRGSSPTADAAKAQKASQRLQELGVAQP